MRSLSGRPRSASATCCPVYWIRWLFSLCFCIFSYMCFILHVFSIHVPWLTLIEHTLSPVLSHVATAYSAPFFFRILSPLHARAPLLYISLYPLLWEFPTFSSTVSSDNMFREISALRRAARHDAAALPSLLTSLHLNLSNRFARLTSLQVLPDIYAYISDDG